MEHLSLLHSKSAAENSTVNPKKHLVNGVEFHRSSECVVTVKQYCHVESEE